MAHEVTLLDWTISLFAARVRIALSEKGIEYERKEEDLENKSSLLLEMNPVHKKIPVLIHKGKPICESNIIVEYIDETWNHKPLLLPSDPYERANARFWAQFIDTKLYGAVRHLMRSSDSGTKAAAAEDVVGCFQVLEGELGNNQFFGGDTFGFLDIAFIPFYNFFYTFETIDDDFEGREILATEYPSVVKEFSKLTSWAERCLQKKSVSSSLHGQYKVHQYIIMMRKKAWL